VNADRRDLDWLLFDLWSALRSIRDDERTIEAGLWQGEMIPRHMRSIMEMRAKLGMRLFEDPAAPLIVDAGA
jgi:hypothetical protein